MASNYLCVNTTIQNVSGRALKHISLFRKSNIGPGETFTVPGDVYAWLTANFPGIKGRRVIELFVNLLNKNILSITEAPTVPCGAAWQSSSSAFFAQ